MGEYVTSFGDGSAKLPPQPLAGCMLYTFSAEAESNKNTPKAISAPSAKNLQPEMKQPLEAHPKVAAWG